MPPRVEDIRVAASVFASTLHEDLDRELTELGDLGADIRARLRRTLTLRTEVAMLKLAGEDTATSEEALSGSLAAIRAQVSQEVAARTDRVLQRGVANFARFIGQVIDAVL